MPEARSAHPSALQNGESSLLPHLESDQDPDLEALPVVQDIMQDRSMTLARFNTDSRLATVSQGLTQWQLEKLARKVYTETRVSEGDTEDTRAVYAFLGLDPSHKNPGKEGTLWADPNAVQAANKMLRIMKERRGDGQRVLGDFVTDDGVDPDQGHRDLGQPSSSVPYLDLSTGTSKLDSNSRRAHLNRLIENPDEIRVPGLPSHNDFLQSLLKQKRFLEFLADARSADPSLSEVYFAGEITTHFKLMDDHIMLSTFHNFYDDSREQALQKDPAGHKRMMGARRRMKKYMAEERGLDVDRISEVVKAVVTMETPCEDVAPNDLDLSMYD